METQEALKIDSARREREAKEAKAAEIAFRQRGIENDKRAREQAKKRHEHDVAECELVVQALQKARAAVATIPTEVMARCARDPNVAEDLAETLDRAQKRLALLKSEQL
jgi:hypothetical protein